MWQFRCRGGTLAVEDSLWIDADGRPQPTQQLVVTGESPRRQRRLGASVELARSKRAASITLAPVCARSWP